MQKKEIFISEHSTIKEALKKLDQTAEKILLVVNTESVLQGTLTDGDLRRYILKGVSLDTSLQTFYHRTPIFLRQAEFSLNKAKHLMINHKIELIPVVNEQNVVLNFITWREVFAGSLSQKRALPTVTIPVVIMAGGKGARLEPFTTVFPKPLIPVGDRTVLETIIEQFMSTNGIRDYYLIVNFKGEMIRVYFDGIEKDYNVHYIFEKHFYGTAGGLKLLPKKIGDVFIVSNCDILVKADYSEVLHFHREQKADMTVLSSIQYYRIPYGVVKFGEGGVISTIEEKPEYSFPVNTGVYVLNRGCLDFIPDSTRFDMPELIKTLIANKKKVVTYPVNESNYIDIGQWEAYRKTLEKLRI